jgi:hypothetical protein
MKVTYVYPPLFSPYYPMATRMFTGNLRQNEKLEATFSRIPVKTYESGVYEALFDRILSEASSMFSPTIRSFMSQKYLSSNLYYVMMTRGYFNDYLFEDREGEYVLMTCINFCDLIIVKQLLENRNRVILGGPLINIKLSPRFIRTLLSKMVVKEELLNRNLIVIAGDIDVTTNLYGYVRRWKDDVIQDTDYGSIYHCENDFLTECFNGSAPSIIHIGFSNRCWYGKCKFCTYKGLPVMDFLSDVHEDRIVDYFRTLKREFGAKELRLIDSYFSIKDRKVRNILDRIREYPIGSFAGILLLKNRNHVEFLHYFLHYLMVGLDSTYSLSYSSCFRFFNRR